MTAGLTTVDEQLLQLKRNKNMRNNEQAEKRES